MLITIGNDAYDCPEQGNWGALKGSVNDSRKIGDHCRATGDWLVYSFENVTEAEFKSFAKQASSRIDEATSVVAFHYSGHAVESQGKTWLIPVIYKQGKGNKVDPVTVSLDTLLQALCKNISPIAKLIVLIDGCRSEPDKEPSEKPPPIHWPPGRAKPDFLQIYACLPGSSAHEINLASGCSHGRLSMVLLKCMQNQKCQKLSDLIREVISEVVKLDKFGSKQKPCYYSTWEPSSTPNFFSGTKLHANDMVKQLQLHQQQMETIRYTVQTGVDECKGRHLRAHQESEKELQESRKEVDKLTSQKCQLEEECTKLKQRLEILEKNKNSDKEEIRSLKTELTEKKRKLRDKEDELKDKTIECEYLQKSLATQLENKEFKCEYLQKRLDASKKRLEEAENARTELEKREHARVPQERIRLIEQEMEKVRQENTLLKLQLAPASVLRLVRRVPLWNHIGW